MPTDGAVLAVPALLTLALPVLAGAVLHALWAADSLVAGRACPALFAAAGPAHAHAVGAAVHRAHLCGGGDTEQAHGLKHTCTHAYGTPRSE